MKSNSWINPIVPYLVQFQFILCYSRKQILHPYQNCLLLINCFLLISVHLFYTDKERPTVTEWLQKTRKRKEKGEFLQLPYLSSSVTVRLGLVSISRICSCCIGCTVCTLVSSICSCCCSGCTTVFIGCTLISVISCFLSNSCCDIVYIIHRLCW